MDLLLNQSFTGITVTSGSATIEDLSAGVYNDITITLNGCTSSDNIDVTLADPTPATISLGTVSNTTTCSGSEGSFQLTGLSVSTAYSVNYTHEGAGVSTSLSSDGSGNLLVNGLNAGSYTNISVIRQNCNSNILAGPVVISDPATATLSHNTSNNPTTCGGSEGSIVLDGLSGSTTYTVNYKFDGSAVVKSLTASGGQLTINNLSSGSYEDISVTAANCTSNTLAGPYTLNDPTSPSIVYDSNLEPSSCSADDGYIRLSGLTASLSYDYQYTKGGVTVNSGTPLTANASGVIEISNLPAGTYTNVSVTLNGTGCQSNTIPSIVLNPPDIVLGTTVNPSTCGGTGGSFEITGMGASTGYDLDYDLDGVAASTVGITADASGKYVLSGIGEGSYTNIRVTNSGCISNSLSTSLSDPTAPTVALGTVTDPTVCSGTGSIQLTGLLASKTYSVSYTNAGTTTVSLGTDGSGNLVISGLSAGSYTNISVTREGCQSNLIASATLSDPAAANIALGTTNDPTTCSGSNGSILLTGWLRTLLILSAILTVGVKSRTFTANGSGDLAIYCLKC